MKRIGLMLVLLISTVGFSQGADSLLQGKWELFNIIDNMTGVELEITHKGNDKPSYVIEFNGNSVKYNLEINKCGNTIIVGKDRTLEWKYFSKCTEICCDGEFSALLTYDECTKYYIKEGKVLIMVSEDRIFYFNKNEA